MPSYAPPKPPKRRRPKPRALNLDWHIKRDTARPYIHALIIAARNSTPPDTRAMGYLDSALNELNRISVERTNAACQRRFTRIKTLVQYAMGLAYEKGTDP